MLMATTEAQMSRHPGLEPHCADLTDIRAGSQAANAEVPQSTASFFALPMFTWADLGDAVGRKSKVTDAEGQRWLIPVRIKWQTDSDIVRLAPGEVATISYRLDAPGLSEAGTVNFTSTTEKAYLDRGELDPRTEQSWVIEALDRRTAQQRAEAMREAGHQAYWRRLLHFSDYAAERIEASHEKMRAEIYATVGIWHDEWLDEAVREQLVSRLVLGDGETESPVQRMLTAEVERSDVFDRVDPYRHAASFIKRAAAEYVYAAIDDPREQRAGQVLRSEAAARGIDDPKRLKSALDSDGGRLAGMRIATIERALRPVPNSSVKHVEVETVTGDKWGGSKPTTAPSANEAW